MKYVRNTRSPSWMNALVPCHSFTPKSVSKLSVMVYHSIFQLIRAFRRSMSACGAREAKARVVSRAFRCATWATWSARKEQPRQACSGQPNTPGSKKARYRTSWRRPSNRSSRLTLPFGPSNSYFFSTAIHGIRRRSAASPSRDRAQAFSFTRSCCLAASHSCGDTIGGVFIAICTFGLSAVRLDIFIAPFFRVGSGFCFLVLLARHFDGQGRQTSGRDRSGDDQAHGCDTEWTHF